jgi:hypothetical protein
MAKGVRDKIKLESTAGTGQGNQDQVIDRVSSLTKTRKTPLSQRGFSFSALLLPSERHRFQLGLS